MLTTHIAGGCHVFLPNMRAAAADMLISRDVLQDYDGGGASLISWCGLLVAAPSSQMRHYLVVKLDFFKKMSFELLLKEIRGEFPCLRSLGMEFHSFGSGN